MDVGNWIDWGKKLSYDKGKVLTVFSVLFYLKVIGERKNKVG